MSQPTDTLVKRLAGASVTKAGLTKDQRAINDIIAKASKGSKFYENEKRKDEAVTERVNKILKERDELLQHANISRIEHQVDKLIAELEASRDLSHYIVHFDMDSFFAAVECLRDPSLKEKAFVVGGSVVSTASYAARAFGVRSGMATWIAKKLCPHLICLHSNFDAYNTASKQVAQIMRKYDADMCMAGCDEGYLDITEYCLLNSLEPDDCVSKMRQEVFEATQLTVSAGIAPNMMLAKICSDKNKPNGQFHLTFEPETIREFMKDLSVRKVPGIGRVQERVLDSVGIQTCGDIFPHRATIQLLNKHFSVDYLLHAYLGLGSTIVQPGVREERKSVGVERTFDPIGEDAVLIAKLEEIATTLEGDLQHGGWSGKTITLKYKLDTFQTFTRAKSLSRHISSKEDLFAIGKELLLAELPLRIRLLGLRATNLKDLKLADNAGIKRYFATGPTSPRKKQKLTHDEPEANHEVVVIDDSSDGDGSTFFDPTEDLAIANNSDPFFRRAASHEPSGSQPEASSSKKPASTAGPPRNVPIFSAIPRPTDQPKVNRRSSAKKAATPAPEPETHECPICGTTLETDNNGLNAHIDYCLSREAIKELAATPVEDQTDHVGAGARLPRPTGVKRKSKDHPSSKAPAPGQRTLEGAFSVNQKART